MQGDFEAHSKAIEKAGGRAIEVRSREEMDRCDGLILPGGESSTMLKLLEYENLVEPHDIDAMVEALLRCVAAPASRELRDYFLARFTSERFVEEMIRVLG